MRKKISPGTVVEKNKFLDETEPARVPLFGCEECGITVDVRMAKKIGPGSWECPNPDCGKVVHNTAKLPMLKDGESDDILEQAIANIVRPPLREKLDEQAPPTFPKNMITGLGVPQYTATGELVALDSVRATWGPETIQVRRYNPIEIGPFEVKTTVLPGETHGDAFARALRMVNQIGVQQRTLRVAAFAKFLQETIGDSA